MKKILWRSLMVILSITMMISCFSACGEDNNSSDKDVDVTSSDTSSTEDNGSENDSTASGDTTNGSSQSGSSTQSSSTQSGTTTGSKFENAYKGIEKYKGKTIKAVLWYVPQASEKKAIKAFEDKYGIKVEIESTANNAEVYNTRVAQIISSGESCDVCLVQNTTLFTYAKNILKSLDSIKTFQKNDPAYDLEQMNTLKVRGKYYGINVKDSWQTDEEVMYFNPNAFKNRGVKSPAEYYKEGNWNWDTFLECAKAMTYADKGTQYYGYTATKWYTFINSAGIDLVTYDGAKLTNNINNQTLLKAMTFTNELYNKYKVCSSKFYDTNGFNNGTVAMFSNLTYSMTKAETAFSDLASGVAVDAVPFPSPKGSKNYVPASYKGFGVMKSSKNPEAAVYFIRWFLDPANDKREFINDKFVALRSQLSASPNKIVPFAGSVFSYGSSINYETFLYDCEYNADPQQISTTAQRYVKILDTAMTKTNKIVNK